MIVNSDPSATHKASSTVDATLTSRCYQIIKQRLDGIIAAHPGIDIDTACQQSSWKPPLDITFLAPTLLTMPEIMSFSEQDMEIFINHMDSTPSSGKGRGSGSLHAEDGPSDGKLRRKTVPGSLVEETRMIMHAFGDASEANTATAYAILLMLSRYIGILFATIEHIISSTGYTTTCSSSSSDPSSPHAKSKVGIDMVALAVIPDLLKVERMRQALVFMKSSKKLEKEEEDETSWESYAKDTDQGDHGHDRTEASTSEDLPTQHRTATHRLLYEELFWAHLFGPSLAAKTRGLEQRRLERLHRRDAFMRHMTQEEFFFFAECAKVSYHRPQRGKLNTFLSKECGLEKRDFVLSDEAVDMIGLLMYDFVEDIVAGTLALLQSKGKTGPITPVHVGMYLASLSRAALAPAPALAPS
eukprot:TRINITY_DN19346_c0_g1_i1.p1 TRINITY_DN19346_c0_g1~~TRINITY_DN19346_c0_g1_i1.p1  ORF type:complete len:476 (-),score=102.82 TRINITY_DN19346_c0_g1_i1:81-1322(-)